MKNNHSRKKNQVNFSLCMILALISNVFAISIVPVSADSSIKSEVTAESQSAPNEKVFSSLDTGNFTYDGKPNSIGWFDKKTEKHPEGGFVLGTRYKTDDQGTTVYCLNWDLDSPQENGNTYRSADEKITDKEYTAMYYGYEGEGDRTGQFTDPQTNKEFSANERYFITQMSLYAVTNDEATKTHLRVEDMIKHTRGMIDEEMSEAILEAVKDQVSFINKNTLKVPEEESIEITIEGSENNEMVQKGTYIELKNPIQVNVSNTKGELALDKSGLNQAYFVDTEGNKVEDAYVLEGNEVSLRVDNEDAKSDDLIEFKVSGEVEYTNLTKYTPKNSGETGVDGDELQRITWVSTEKSEAESNFNVTYEFVEGDLEITKKELDSEQVLPNAEFVIKDENDHTVHEGTTNDEGKIRVENLPKGTYTYQETKAPKGYVLDDDVDSFEIKKNGENVKLTVENEIIEGSLNIVKKDAETETVLEGVEFELMDDENEVVQTGKTDQEGKLSFTELPYGKYTLKEIATLEGYAIDESEFNFEIDTEGQVVEKEMTNSPVKGDLEITKTDFVTGEVLAHTKFAVIDSNGEVVREGETDEEGLAYFANLPYGKYTYKEVAALEGYVMDENEYPFEIKENGEVVKAEMTNKREEVATGSEESGKDTGDKITPTANNSENNFENKSNSEAEGLEGAKGSEGSKGAEEVAGAGNFLPKTASSIFNTLLIGVALLVSGAVAWFVMNRKKGES